MSIKCYSLIINLNFIIMEKSRTLCKKLLKTNGITCNSKTSNNCRGNPCKSVKNKNIKNN